MKKLVLVAVAASFAFVSCKKEDASSRIKEGETTTTQTTQNTTAPAEGQTATTTPQGGFAVAKFDKMEHDFGNLKKGSKGETEFTITNTGTSDLVIVDAHASCGCTVPEYPKTPIKPGASEKIKVAFSANSPGLQNKTVTIKANTENGQELLKIKANVTE